MAPDSEHNLLLRHFESWATAKGASVDLDLLGRLLALRFRYDDVPATYWPAGSVEDLLLRLWPAKGDVDSPAEQAVVDTLDAYVRFLRNTGRMSARSASPAELRKETQRSVRRMHETAADPSNWSPGKSLMQYGRSIGIQVDDLPDLATLQEHLDRITESWNALPIHERRRLQPRPGDDQVSGCESAMRAYGVDDPITALITSFAPELPTGELPQPELVAPLVRASSFMQQVNALCEWIGDRTEVTSTGVLRPAVAHEAYDALGLAEWTEQKLRREYAHYRPPAMLRMGAEAWIGQRLQEPWRNAADCLALDRLWRGAVACGAIEIQGKWAYARFPTAPDAERWVRMGVSAVNRLLEDLCEWPGRAFGLVYGLLRSYVKHGAPVSEEEILAFVGDWEDSAAEREQYRTIGYDPTASDKSRLARACGAVADTGIMLERDDGLQLTPFGDVAVTAWLNYRRADR
ncbi:hypothetical protein BH18ACT8_BH18ACT8_07790 [soil metagenome]